MFNLYLNILILFGSIFFALSGRHLLNSLIMLEYLVLMNFLIFLLLSASVLSSYIFTFLFFVLTVSSAALGLSLLICLCRTHGKDYLSSFNVLC